MNDHENEGVKSNIEEGDENKYIKPIVHEDVVVTTKDGEHSYFKTMEEYLNGDVDKYNLDRIDTYFIIVDRFQRKQEKKEKKEQRKKKSEERKKESPEIIKYLQFIPPYDEILHNKIVSPEIRDIRDIRQTKFNEI